MKYIPILLASALLSGCTLTVAVKPWYADRSVVVQPMALPTIEAVAAEPCKPPMLDEPAALPSVPKLSAAAQVDTGKAYLEIVSRYKELRSYSKSLRSAVMLHRTQLQEACH